MALWNKIKEKEKEQHHQNQSEYNCSERILNLINTAFGLPDDIRAQVISAIDESVEKGLNGGSLDYFKVIEVACEGYSKEQIAEAYGHQILGAYVAYLIMTGKPLKLK
jgi:superfamily II DNA/RNA helicase